MHRPFCLCLALLASLIMPPAAAEQVLAAVAANFAGAMERIAARFNATSGHRVAMSYGATGKFYTQIKNGAPFDVLLAADSKSPELLEREGAAVPGTRFTYAVGKLVLWSARPGYVDGQGAVLRTGNFKHLAIANPKTAPYGAAAQRVLERLGLWGQLQPRLVTGENITQTYQFVATGNAELGFVALSQLKQAQLKQAQLKQAQLKQAQLKRAQLKQAQLKGGGKADGSHWLVPQDLYPALVQQAVLLKHGKDNPAARALLDFLKTGEARAIIEGLGYTLE